MGGNKHMVKKIWVKNNKRKGRYNRMGGKCAEKNQGLKNRFDF